jgi:hypothetical protein
MLSTLLLLSILHFSQAIELSTNSSRMDTGNKFIPPVPKFSTEFIHNNFTQNQTQFHSLQMDSVNSKIIISNDTSEFEDNSPIYAIGMLRMHSNNCPYTLKDAFIVKVHFWTNVINKKFFTAYLCSKVTETWTHTPDEHNVIQWDIQTTTQRVSQKACEYMVYYRRSPQYQPLTWINSTHMETSERVVINNTMLHHTNSWQQSVTNYNLQLINATISENSGAVKSSDVDMQQCEYHNNFCYVRDDIIIWNVQDTQSCTFKRQESTHCYLTPNQLTCPSLFITILDFNMAKIYECGIHLGMTRSQILSTPSISAEKLIDLDSKYRVDMKLERLYNNIRIGKMQHVQIFHVSSCGNIPQEVQVDDKRYKPNTMKGVKINPESEIIDVSKINPTESPSKQPERMQNRRFPREFDY